jgi:protein translocase SEC61 complex gamma subunit
MDIPGFFNQSVRTMKIARKPKQKEFMKMFKIVAAIAFIIGFIGFVITFIVNLFPKV